MEPKNVMVIGGGIAGMTAAWELAESNISVQLIEKSGFLGGHAIQYTCKATSECLNCGACAVEKMLKNVMGKDNIGIHLSSQIEKITQNGSYTATIKKSPVFIDDKKCTNCGICYEKLKDTGVIVRGHSKNNVPLYAICEEKLADHGDALKDVCPEGAISVSETTSHTDLTADAVIVATGFEPFDPDIKATYGYSIHPNVISGLDLERIKRQNGSLIRPSDGKAPKKIAFIQCVGSRDERLGNLWCSQVCCPYALRTAESIKYKDPDLDITIFYMDIQNTGNTFPAFYESCKNNLRFIRSIPVDIFPAENGNLLLRLFDETDGTPKKESFDMVVLSIGIMPNPENRNLSTLLEISLDEDGFFKNLHELNQTSTSNNGVFIAGTAHGPKSISASIAHAGQAVSGVRKYLGGAI